MTPIISRAKSMTKLLKRALSPTVVPTDKAIFLFLTILKDHAELPSKSLQRLALTGWASGLEPHVENSRSLADRKQKAVLGP